MRPELRPYQLKVKEAVRQKMREHRRVVIIQAATGAGKTSIAASIVADAAAKNSNVLFLAHRRRLIDQISGRLTDFGVDHGVFMRGHKFDKFNSIQVASKDTFSSRCIDNQWHGAPPANLVIVDECRRAMTKEYQDILKNYGGAKIIGLDATPVGLKGWADDMVCAAQTSELIRDGYLVPVKCFAPERMGQQKKKGRKIKGIAGDLVESWKSFAENLPTVVFCSRVSHSLDAVAMFIAAGIPAAHVDADTPDDVRDRIFDQLLTGEIKIVSNVGILSEGVDIPCLGCCVLWCNIDSRVHFLQCIGRIMRPHPGKNYAILIDHAAAVFQHGFPDDDTHWSLDDDTDAQFRKDKKEGKAKEPRYCSNCSLIYNETLACPQCGHLPEKPPKSIWAAEPMEVHNEVLTECERVERDSQTEHLQRTHWFRALGEAANMGNTFAQAGQIWKRKFRKWPPSSLPCQPPGGNWKMLVQDAYPQFGKKKKT